MADGDGRNEENSADDRPTLQFGLRRLWWLTMAVGLLFGILRGLGIPPETMILILMIAAAAATIAVMVAILRK